MCKHPAYGQSLLKLGLHLSDPLAELGMVWARGDHASARLIHQAMLSAEHLRRGRDKMLSRIANSIVNKLNSYHEEAKRFESTHSKSPYKAASLVGRRNPGKHKRRAAAKKRAKQRWETAWDRECKHGVVFESNRFRDASERACVRVMRVGKRNPNARPNENEIPTVIIKRVKRNPHISSKDASAMCRILRNHGYTCTKKGAKRRSKSRR